MKKAIILFNLGGPDKLENVEPFLFNLFNDPAILGIPGFLRYPLAKLISKKRTPIAKKIYTKIGGGSPILQLTNKQAESLEKKFNINKIIFAYEPVWSIGTNKIPKMNDLKNTIKFIKSEFKKTFKTEKSPKVLYGGSVNDKNISLFSSISEIDGFLIGGASQSSKKFIDIVKNYYK